MLKIPFREHHLIELLTGYDKQSLPIDVYVSHYFKEHKALGSKDRAFIADQLYALLRWKRLLDELGATDWATRLEKWKTIDPLHDTFTLPPAARLSFPDSLYTLIIQSLGEEKGNAFCMASNQPAPTTVRINPLKTTRDDLFKKWQEKGFHVLPCRFSPLGITFLEKIHFFTLPEFKEGLFEVQDEGSQLVGDLMQIRPGDLVLDFCAGAGGKTLAFAPRMENRGQIYLHDIRPYALHEAKKRLNRANIQNFQILQPDAPQYNKLKKKMDWVLVDVPCSGTGTLRRNPDRKWKLDQESIIRLQGEQRLIFEKALSFVKPGGHLVFATCSVLKEENEEQTAHFLKTYPITAASEPFQSIPQPGGMDGFYGMTFKKS